MTKIKDCIAETMATDALSRFTSDELDSYIKEVADRTRELKDEGIPFARKRAVEEINKEMLNSLLTDAAISVNDVAKFDVMNKKMDSGVIQRSLLEKTAKNTDFNIETAQRADINKLSDGSFNTLSKEHMEILYENKKNEEIYAYVDGVKTDNSMIKDIGDRLKDYWDNRNGMMIRSNAIHPSGIRDDRFFKAGYNQSKIGKMEQNQFVESMRGFINIEETFKHTKAVDADGKVNLTIVDEMIGNTYTNIMQGNGPLFTSPSIAKDLGKIKKKREMFYIYKDMRSWGESNKIFGNDSLIQAWNSDIYSSGSKSGMAKVMGSQPQYMYNEIRKISLEGKENTVKESIKNQSNDALFNQLLGGNQGVYNATVANIGAGVRTLSSMAKMAGLVLRSLSDHAQVAGISYRLTGDYWGPYFNSIRNMFNLMPSEGRQELAKIMRGVIDTHNGAAARHVDMSDTGSVVNRMSNKFFWANGSQAFDYANKISSMEPVMNAFGKESNLGFNELNKAKQNTLTRFNISEVEWDGLRAKTQNERFTVDNVNNLTDTELKSLWDKTDKSSSLTHYRDDLYRKVFGIFDTAHEFGTLNPDAFIKMLSSGNTKGGTLPAEIWRSVMQFKSYPLQYFRRVIYGGMQEMDSASAKLMYGLHMSLGTIMLEQLSQVLVDISNGVSPVDPSKLSNFERTKHGLKMLAGGAGVFNRVMDPRSQNKDMFISLFNTPALRLAEEPFVAAFSLLSANPKGAKKAAKDFVNVANPIGSVPVISPFINSLLGSKPYMDKGQHRIFGE